MLRLFKNYRHTRIIENIEKSAELRSRERVSMSESFKKYIDNILPTYEKTIETRILNTVYHKLPTDVLKNQLLNAYQRRRLDVLFRIDDVSMSVFKRTDQRSQPPSNAPYCANDITRTNFAEVGYFYDFGLPDFLKYFPAMNFGQNEFIEKNMMFSLRFAIQMTPEAFAVTELLKAHDQLYTVPLENFKPSEILGLAQTKDDLEFLFKDRELFLKLLFTFTNEFREVINEHRFEEKPFTLFANSFMVDYINLILIWQLHRPEIQAILLDAKSRKECFRSLFRQIIEHPESHFFVPNKITSWIELQKQIFLSASVKIDLITSGQDYCRLPSALKLYMLPGFVGLSSNLLFWGVGGTGKSGAMYAATMWAIKSGWLVFKLPSVRALTFNNRENLLRHEKSRLFLNAELAVELLKDIQATNSEILNQIPVNLSFYGNYDVAGVHKDEPNPVPNFFIEDRQTYFYEADKFFFEDEVESAQTEQIDFDIPMSSKLQAPKTLSEIVDFGIENTLYATACIAELLEQAYHLDSHSVLIAIDDYNWFYRPSNQPAFMYQNIKGLNGMVPPYHIALCRLFMKFDGHRIKRGFKIAATSNFSITKHYFEPRKINFPEEFCHRLLGVPLESLPHFIRFAQESNLDLTGEAGISFVRRLWMETQGNYGKVIVCLNRPERKVV